MANITDNSMANAREKDVMGEVEEGKGGRIVMERDLLQYIEDLV